MKKAWKLSGETETTNLYKSERYDLVAGRAWIPKRYMESNKGESHIRWGELIQDVDGIIQRVPAIAYENEIDITLDRAKITGFSRESGFPDYLELVFEPRPIYVEPDIEPGIVRLCSFRSCKDFSELYFMAATSGEKREKIGIRIPL